MYVKCEYKTHDTLHQPQHNIGNCTQTPDMKLSVNIFVTVGIGLYVISALGVFKFTGAWGYSGKVTVR